MRVGALGGVEAQSRETQKEAFRDTLLLTARMLRCSGEVGCHKTAWGRGRGGGGVKKEASSTPAAVGGD